MRTATYDVENVITKKSLEGTYRRPIKGYVLKHCQTENMSKGTLMHDGAPSHMVKQSLKWCMENVPDGMYIACATGSS